MSTFDNKPFKKVTLKSTTTFQCYNYKTVQSNSYLASPLIHNYTTSDDFSNITYEIYVPSIDNDWVYRARKYGEEYFNSQHNRSTKETLKQHVQKMNEIFRTN